LLLFLVRSSRLDRSSGTRGGHTDRQDWENDIDRQRELIARPPSALQNYRSPYMRITRRHLILVCVGLPWAIALAATAYFVFSPSPEQKMIVEHAKLRRLLVDLDTIEKDLSNRVNELDAAGHGIDVGNIYQGINLSKIEGTNDARQRVQIFDTQMNGFGALLEGVWTRIADKVNASDLDEPLATQLKTQLSRDESDIYPKYRDWILAARENVEAITHYLDVNEHYLGQFHMTNNSLTFTNPSVPADIAKAQAALATAEDHYKRASRAALQNHGDTIKFVLSTLREMEKGMTRRDGANETDPEKKPQ
jgi:hypothetical protein